MKCKYNTNACSPTIIRENVLYATFREECWNGEAESDERQSVEQQEDECYRPVRVVDDCSTTDFDVEKERHQDDWDEHEDGVLEEPRQPV